MKQRKDFDTIEELLQTEANSFEMFPSDGVWNSIATTVQEKNRWPALTIIAFAIIVALSISTFLNYPPDNLVAKIRYRDSVTLVQQQILASQPPIQLKENFIETFSKQTANPFATSSTNSNNEVIENTFVPATTATIKKPIVPILATKELPNILPNFTSNNFYALQESVVPNETNTTQKNNIVATETFNNAMPIVYANGTGSTTIDKFIKTKPKWTIEFYFTPSFSYRKLVDESKPTLQSNNILSNTALLALNITTPLNELIRHKPAMGFEVGTAIGYAVSPTVTIKTGVQFNMRKYYIDAFVNNSQINIATLNNSSTPVRVLTDISNTTGNTHALLNNQLYQLSVPIGIDWKALAYKKLSVHVNASVQPTLTLNKDLYLLSTDYKYYAQGESFLRTFNINTAADIRFQYNTRKGSFYLGPQIRFQHLPTYNSAYSIKEYRWDYGVRLGFITQLKN